MNILHLRVLGKFQEVSFEPSFVLFDSSIIPVFEPSRGRREPVIIQYGRLTVPLWFSTLVLSVLLYQSDDMC